MSTPFQPTPAPQTTTSQTTTSTSSNSNENSEKGGAKDKSVEKMTKREKQDLLDRQNESVFLKWLQEGYFY